VNLYALEVTAENHLGDRVGLDLHLGRPVIASMIYSSCATACPRQIFDVQRTELLIPPDALEQVRVLAISFDPQRDTPEVLAASAASHNVDLSRWSFLRPSAADARRIADTLGVSYTEQDDGTWKHDSVLALIEPNGDIGVTIEGVSQDTQPIIDRVLEITASGQ